jgi:hypothetical protein
MAEELAAANVNRSYSLAGTSIAIFTFILIFMYPRFASGEIGAVPLQATLGVMGVATFSFVFASFSYYCSAVGRFDDAGRARHSRRGDRSWLLGYTLLFLVPSLILFSVRLRVVGAAWLVLWLAYLVLVVRYFPRLQTPRQDLSGGGSAMHRSLAVALACAALSSCHAGRIPAADALASDTTVTPAALEAHLQVLGHDSLEGRGTGTRGYDRAVRYVIAQFQRLGLEAAGTQGFLQPVRLRRGTVREAGLTIQGPSGRRELQEGRDFVGIPHLSHAAAEVTAPVVFVGFGVTASGRGHDDYRGVDARGKIVAVLTGAPAAFPATERAHYSTTREKAGNAERHGAVGMLIVRGPDFPVPWGRQVEQARAGTMRWLETDGTPHGVYPALRAVAMVSDSAAAVFREAGSVTATIRVSSDYADLESPNVAALLRGSDPRLRDEVVVVTAHLDHLGIGAPVDGDSIYNGVWDNASGIAAMLEVARAAAARPERPRRSLLFLAVTAEERGLLGSDYFAEHPTVPIERIVADVNLDGLSIFYPLREIVAHGAAHSTLEAAALRAAARLGIEIAPDPIPQEVIFIRSDQYSFVLRGVPSIFFVPGFGSAPGVDGRALFQQWLTTWYHRPSDDLGRPRDLEAGAAHANLALLVALDVANAEERPAWKPGDFFGERFGRR